MLPTVLVTEVIRSTHMGQFHGGAHLVNLETGDSTKVLSWDDGSIDFEGRGGMRGLRGIAFHNNEIYIAAHDELFVFDNNFNKLRSFPCENLTQCHEIAASETTLYLTSTKRDSILEFDFEKQAFTKGHLLVARQVRKQIKRKVVTETEYSTEPFDPSANPGPPVHDLFHINNVFVDSGRIFIGGVRLSAVLELLPEGATKQIGKVPDWTHNARPFRTGLLYNSTEQDAVVWGDKNARPLVSLKIPKYPENQLENANLPRDIARQGFGRGLAVTDTGLIIAGSSPSTITVHDPVARKTIKKVNLTMDVRHAPHGLEIWPF
jgi:hypothetical protein